MRVRWLLFGCLCVLGACGQSPKSNWEKGESGYVARVTDGDTLALNTGQVVRMVSIEAPSFGYRGRQDMPYAEESKKTLERLALGQQVTLYYPGMTRDRYDRALAQVWVSPKTDAPFWLNKAMVQSGAAWVRIYPDTSKGSEALWSAEYVARQKGSGVWETNAPIYEAVSDLPQSGFVILVSAVTDARVEKTLCHFKLADKLEARVPLTLGRVCPVETGQRYEVRGWRSKRGLIISSPENVRPPA